MKSTLADFKKWYHDHFREIQQDYFTFLRFPSISTDPHFKPQVHQAAAWVKEYLTKIGFKTQLWQTNFHPVVFASHIVDPSLPTVLIYHHYDVQPVDPLDKWVSPPFEPAVREGRVYARGASDNKGQCFYTLTALKALFQLCQEIKLNIKLFIEGEEECGSRGAAEVLKTRQKELQADHLLIVDAGLPAPGVPAITLGL